MRLSTPGCLSTFASERERSPTLGLFSVEFNAVVRELCRARPRHARQHARKLPERTSRATSLSHEYPKSALTRPLTLYPASIIRLPMDTQGKPWAPTP